MQEIIFYDSKNVPYMTWYNFSYNQQMGHYYLMYSLNIPSLIFPNVIRPILHKSLILRKNYKIYIME